MSRLALRPNVGAEEPDGPRVDAARAVGRLWRLLFPADAEWPEPEAAAWPEAWHGPRDAGAFDWLPESGLCAWWNDPASAEAAREAGLALAGPAPEVVARVHDKAFSVAVCDAERLWPDGLRDVVRVYGADELADASAFRETLRRELAGWPADLSGSATLKPRLGTSGRGRVQVADVDDPAWTGALPRLAARGGAVLEPWLSRVADYSVQLHVARDGTLTLLGSLELCTSPSGGYRGHRGELDHRSRVTSGSDVDGELLGPATELARAAHAAGFFGPCGVDAFRYRRGGSLALRPVVELNARFTMGTVVLGLLRRARPWLDAVLPGTPGTRRAFAFGFGEASGDELPGAEQRIALDDGRCRLALAGAPG